MQYWIGIDPGASGALCILAEDDTVYFVDYKTNGIKGYVESNIEAIKPEKIALEKVASRTGQGVKSVFSFGQRFGELEGMLQTLNLEYSLVSPQIWQKTLGVIPKSGKQGIYNVVSKLYPHAELTGPRGGLLDGRCDALALAHYARHYL